MNRNKLNSSPKCRKYHGTPQDVKTSSRVSNFILSPQAAASPMEMQILMQFHNLEEKLKKVAIVINIFFSFGDKKKLTFSFVVNFSVIRWHKMKTSFLFQLPLLE